MRKNQSYTNVEVNPHFIDIKKRIQGSNKGADGNKCVKQDVDLEVFKRDYTF